MSAPQTTTQKKETEKITTRLTFEMDTPSIFDATPRLVRSEIKISRSTAEQLAQRPGDFVRIMEKNEPECMAKMREFGYLENSYRLEVSSEFYCPIRFALGIEAVAPKDLPAAWKKMRELSGHGDTMNDEWMKGLTTDERPIVISYNYKPVHDFTWRKLRDGEIFLPVQAYPPSPDSKVKITGYWIKGDATGWLIAGERGMHLRTTAPKKMSLTIGAGEVTTHVDKSTTGYGLGHDSESELLALCAKLFRKESPLRSLEEILEKVYGRASSAPFYMSEDSAPATTKLLNLLRTGKAKLSEGKEETVRRGNVSNIV